MKHWKAPLIGALLTVFAASIWLAISLVGGCAKGDLVVQPAKTLVGANAFERVFSDSTGLGPLFNGTSCVSCHNRDDEAPILGGAGDEIERHQVGDMCAVTVLHEFPVPEIATGPIGLRDANDLFGLGHLDQLSDLDIIHYIQSEPRFLGFIDGQYWYNSPQINLVNGQVGKFGRKCEVPNLRTFIAKAFANEIGIDEGTEISSADIDATYQFVANGLVRPGKSGAPRVADPPFGFKNFTIPPGRVGKRDSVPPQPPPPPPDSTPPPPDLVATGATLFKAIGCAMCHNPQTEYTDLALHNLGESDICNKPPEALALEPGARAEEFRTEPLTGLGLQSRFMHDGASTTLEDAIARHGHEAGFSRAKFNHLNDRDNALRDIGQRSIIAFLRSL